MAEELSEEDRANRRALADKLEDLAARLVAGETMDVIVITPEGWAFSVNNPVSLVVPLLDGMLTMRELQKMRQLEQAQREAAENAPRVVVPGRGPFGPN